MFNSFCKERKVIKEEKEQEAFFVSWKDDVFRSLRVPVVPSRFTELNEWRSRILVNTFEQICGRLVEVM